MNPFFLPLLSLYAHSIEPSKRFPHWRHLWGYRSNAFIVALPFFPLFPDDPIQFPAFLPCQVFQSSVFAHCVTSNAIQRSFNAFCVLKLPLIDPPFILCPLFCSSPSCLFIGFSFIGISEWFPYTVPILTLQSIVVSAFSPVSPKRKNCKCFFLHVSPSD